jgi:hypothetical protein
MSTIVAPPSNARKWQVGFNLAFKGLIGNIMHLFELKVPKKENKTVTSTDIQLCKYIFCMC